MKNKHSADYQLSEINIEELEDRVEFSFCQGICFSDAGIPQSCVQPYVER